MQFLKLTPERKCIFSRNPNLGSYKLFTFNLLQIAPIISVQGIDTRPLEKVRSFAKNRLKQICSC